MSGLNPLDLDEVDESVESAALWVENDLYERSYDQRVVRAFPAVDKNTAVFLVQLNADTTSQIESLSHIVKPVRRIQLVEPFVDRERGLVAVSVVSAVRTAICVLARTVGSAASVNQLVEREL